MATLQELKRKYSWGPIPQWELDNMEKPQASKDEPKRGRKPKAVETDNGDSTADSDQSA